MSSVWFSMIDHHRLVPLAFVLALGACGSSSGAPPTCDQQPCPDAAADAPECVGSSCIDAAVPDASVDAPVPGTGEPWQYVGTGPKYERVASIDAASDGGAVLVVRSSTTLGGVPYASALVRLDGAGAAKWTTTYACGDDDNFGGWSQAFFANATEIDLVVFCVGGAAVSGYATPTTSTWTVYRVRDSDGVVLSHATLAANDKARGEVVARAGRIYAAFRLTSGAVVGGMARQPGGMMAAFDRSTGALVASQFHATWWPERIAVTSMGDMWTGGGFRGTLTLGAHSATAAGVDDAVLVKMAPDGSVTAFRTFGSAQAGQDDVFDIAVGADGKLAVTGTITRGSVGGAALPDYSLFIAAYDAGGGHLWSHAIAGDDTRIVSRVARVGDKTVGVGDRTTGASTILKWFVIDAPGSTVTEQELGEGGTLFVETSVSAANGRVLMSGGFRGDATVLGRTHMTTDQDALAIAATAP